MPGHGAAERRVLKVIWLAAGQPCGRMLKAVPGIWMPYYEKRHGVLAEPLREKARKANAATIDRLLAPRRVALGLCCLIFPQ